MLRKLLLGTATVLVLLAGCGNHGGNEFLGKWRSVKIEKRTVEIVRNEDSFILCETAPSLINGKMET